MVKFKSNLVLLVVVLTMVGVVAYVFRNKPETPLAPVAGEVLHVDPAHVTGIVMHSPAGDLRLEKTGQGWQMKEPFDAKAYDKKIDQFLQQAFPLVVDQVMDADVAETDLPTYGLDKPLLRLTLHDDGGKESVLEAGHSAPVGQYYYARVRPSLKIFMLPYQWTYEVFQNPTAYQDLRLFAVDSADILTSVSWVKGGETFVLEKKDKQWLVNGQAANADAVQGLFHQLMGLTCAEENELFREDMYQEPLFEVVYKTILDDQEHRVVFGAKDKEHGRYFVKLEGSSRTQYFSETAFKTFDVDVKNLMPVLAEAVSVSASAANTES